MVERFGFDSRFFRYIFLTASQQDLIEDYRMHFIGEVDLDEKDEPLLKESSCRFVPNIMRCTRFFCRILLTQHHCHALPKQIWQMYKKVEASFWTAEAMDLFKDLHDWEDCLNDNERHFVLHVLAFFATLDGRELG
jgi:ribonucleoside-diphosphate reductase subunit M2